MRRHLSRLAAVAVSVTLAAGVCSAATAVPASSGRLRGQATRTTSVFLINGERPGAASPGGQTQILTLRTSATDAAGGSVTETIDNAYQIAS